MGDRMGVQVADRCPPALAARPAAPRVAHEVLRDPGRPLDAATRRFMEPRFGRDFSGVRVHLDARAGDAARAIHAAAYTVGQHIAFAPGRYAPASAAGRDILAHELTHTVQQRGAPARSVEIGAPDDALEHEARTMSARIATQEPPREPGRFSRAAALGVQRQPEGEDEWPPEWFTGGGGEFGGGGASGSWDEPEQKPKRPPCIGHGCHDYLDPKPRDWFPRMPSPFPRPMPPIGPPGPSPARRLDFFHGTKWSVAKQIPGNVKPVGGGDFGAGFYLHYDNDSSKALKRAVKWGQVIAKAPPPEAYVGVIRFDVDMNDYSALYAGGKGKTFGLRDPKQPDYDARQKAWIDFVTAGGREAQPTFRQRKGRGEWVHKRRTPQPDLGYNVIAGPFYQPIPGEKSRKPASSEFAPFQEGSKFPQQELWAHEGIKLLNSSKVKTELMQFDAKTGKRVDPPVEYSMPVTASQDTAALEEAAQFSMGTP